MFSKISRNVSLVFVFAILMACSPPFNWREIPNNELGYIATFPDKPVSASRELNLDGFNVPLTLHAAKVEDLYFTVGVVPLDADLATHLDRLVLAMAQSLGNNIQAKKIELVEETWQGKRAKALKVTGTLPSGGSAYLRGYFVEHEGNLIEVVLMGAKSQVTDVIETQWFTGFKWLRN